MSMVYALFLGKVTKIEDPQCWAIKAEFYGQESLGEDGVYAMPLGPVVNKIEVDDPVMLFRLDEKPGTYYYLELHKGKGRIGLFNSDSYLDFTDPKQIVIKHEDKTYIQYDGETYVNVKSNLTLNGPGKLVIKGVSVPDSSNPGPFCSLPNCLMTGGPHSAASLTLTNPTETLPETEPESE